MNEKNSLFIAWNQRDYPLKKSVHQKSYRLPFFSKIRKFFAHLKKKAPFFEKHTQVEVGGIVDYRKEFQELKQEAVLVKKQLNRAENKQKGPLLEQLKEIQWKQHQIQQKVFAYQKELPRLIQMIDELDKQKEENLKNLQKMQVQDIPFVQKKRQFLQDLTKLSLKEAKQAWDFKENKEGVDEENLDLFKWRLTSFYALFCSLSKFYPHLIESIEKEALAEIDKNGALIKTRKEKIEELYGSGSDYAKSKF